MRIHTLKKNVRLHHNRVIKSHRQGSGLSGGSFRLAGTGMEAGCVMGAGNLDVLRQELKSIGSGSGSKKVKSKYITLN